MNSVTVIKQSKIGEKAHQAHRKEKKAENRLVSVLVHFINCGHCHTQNIHLGKQQEQYVFCSSLCLEVCQRSHKK